VPPLCFEQAAGKRNTLGGPVCGCVSPAQKPSGYADADARQTKGQAKAVAQKHQNRESRLLSETQGV